MKALKVYLILFSFLFSLSGFAFDFEKDGIYYNILSEDDKTAEVTSGDVSYTGDIVIPAEVNGYSITEIGEHAFEYSTITSVNIPSSVIRIKKNAFFECKGLTSVAIPSKQIVISPYAFMFCENLVSLTIFGEVKSIGSKAFSYCTSLKDIYLYARTVKKDFSVHDNTFSNVSSDIITHVYKGMEEMYSYYGRGMGFPHIVGDLAFQVYDGEVYTDTITQKFVEIEYVRNFENTKWQPLYVPFDINYLDVKDEFEIAKIENVYIEL
ncbi:MAG: leucine-rich repeat domain-containing protein, partial [Bacteroidaceae bacterium]|nr:leucine-rich repeat domain-containing protein [Bacteroidaceae bacterium]